MKFDENAPLQSKAWDIPASHLKDLNVNWQSVVVKRGAQPVHSSFTTLVEQQKDKTILSTPGFPILDFIGHSD